MAVEISLTVASLILEGIIKNAYYFIKPVNFLNTQFVWLTQISCRRAFARTPRNMEYTVGP